MKQDITSLKNSYDKLASEYDSETNTFAHQIDDFIIEKHLDEFIQKYHFTNILDCGGGTGKWSIYFIKKGFNVTLLDISSENLKIAYEKFESKNININIVESNAEKTPFKDNEFDLIFLEGGVISYTPNPDILLKEIFRILKPNGFCWIDFYNSAGWALETYKLIDKIDYLEVDEKLIQMCDWDYPSRIFSVSRMKEKIELNGFKIIKCFGNHILLNSISLGLVYSKEFDINEMNKIRAVELSLSNNVECIGTAKNYKIISQKVI